MYPEHHIEKIIYPFYSQINGQKIKVYFGRKSKYSMEIEADWKKYQLIIFNIIQNAVKYNVFRGEIIIMLSCEEVDDNEHNFITEVIDSGIGITKGRKQTLFVPFLELKMKQCMENL